MPTSYYGATKLCAEQLALAEFRERGFPACSLRLYSVYGPRERPEKLFPKLIKAILEDKAFPLFEDSAAHVRSFTYVKDAAEGIASVVNHIDGSKGEIFHIGSGIEMTTGEAIKIVEKHLGRAAKISKTPKRPGDQLKTWANIEKAKKILGYNPRTMPEQGLRAEVDWYVKEIHGRV
jgi:nucleoside-diphosphate-sugar epimerase